MMNQHKNDFKIQTGLRVPEEQHQKLQAQAEKMGVSVNALILMLIEIGFSLMENGFTLPGTQE